MKHALARRTIREIKFRAWDLKTNYMHYGNQYITMSLDGQGRLSSDELIFMQYTGLKDKNGNEIYEGDIINCLHPISKKFVAYGEVSFKNGCFKFDYINDPWNLFTASEIEVVGNIYEK